MNKLVLLLIFSISFSANANSFFIGVGGSYSSITLPSNNGGLDSSYQGPGYLAEGRLRIFPFKEKRTFSFDIFGQLGQNFTNNTGAADSQRQDCTSAGVDLNFRSLSFGAQYGRTRAYFQSASSNINLNYDWVAPRISWTLYRSLNWNISVNAAYQMGTAIPGSDNPIARAQKINQLIGGFIFQYQIAGEKKSY